MPNRSDDPTDALIAQLIPPITAAVHQSLQDAIAANSISEEERAWLRLAVRRAAQQEAFRRAVIEKTLAGLIWAGIVWIGFALWEAFKASLHRG